MPIEQDVLLTNEPYQVTPEQAELRARKAYDIALREQLPVGYIEKNMELYDSGAYREKVNEWKHKIENAPDEERSMMMFWSQAGNIFNVTSYMSRKGWLFTEENRGNTSAFFDAMEEYHRDMKRPTINVLGKEIRLPHPSYVAGGVVRAAAEFEAIPIGAEKAATWMGRMGETAGKFAAQTTLQAPTERESAMPAGEFIKQKAGAAVKSAITGAGVSVVGKYVPNPFFRIPTVTGGFMSLTALEGGTAEEVLTTGVNILGFEALGLAQQSYAGKADIKKAIASAKEKEPKLNQVSDNEIERILKEINTAKGVSDASTKVQEQKETTKIETPKQPYEITRDDVKQILANQPNNKEKNIDDLADKWVASDKFVQMTIPINSVGIASAPTGVSQTKGAIIVDLNINEAGRLDGKYGTPPDVLVIDGKHRISEAKQRGETTINAMVGEKALPAIQKAIDEHNGRNKAIEEATLAYQNNPNGSTLRALQVLLPENEVLKIRNAVKAQSSFNQPAPEAKTGAESTTAPEEPVGTGEVKPSRLSERVVEKLSKTSQEMKDALGDADEYKTTSFEEQARLVTDLETKDFEKLIKIATGEARPPEGMLPNAAYVHLVNLADTTGNVELALRLKNSRVSLTNTRKGQDIVMLKNLNENSSVDTISKVEKAVEKSVDVKLKKQGTSLKAEKERMSKEMSDKVKEKPLNLDRLKKFIEDIRCE